MPLYDSFFFFNKIYIHVLKVVRSAQVAMTNEIKGTKDKKKIEFIISYVVHEGNFIQRG